MFFLLNGFQRFGDWSPWAGRDPNAEFRVSGPASGVGARLEWSGDPRLVGTGWQEIVESQPWSLVRNRLFVDQQGLAETAFRIEQSGPGIRLTWSFDMDLVEGQGLFGSLLARYFGLFFDTWVGSDYEEGLGRLKQLAESLPRVEFSSLQVEELDVQGLDIIYVPLAAAEIQGDLTAGLAEAYRMIGDFMTANELQMRSQPMAITLSRADGGQEVSAAIPVATDLVVVTGALKTGRSPSGRALRIVHKGPYERMVSSYERLGAWMSVHGKSPGPVSWEHYISDPEVTRPENLITHIYVLLEPVAEGIPQP